MRPKSVLHFLNYPLIPKLPQLLQEQHVSLHTNTDLWLDFLFVSQADLDTSYC